MELKIVEGFDMTGKSAIIEAISSNKSAYRMDYTYYDSVFDNRNYAFMYSLAQADLFQYLSNKNYKFDDSMKDLTYDRAVFSSYVYSRLYKQGTNLELSLIYNYINKVRNFFDKLKIYYARHYDKSSAERMYNYEFRKDSTTHNDKMDSFLDFENYWKLYMKADYLFLGLLTEVSYKFPEFVKVYDISTKTNDEGSRVKLVDVDEDFFKGDEE